MYVYIVIPSLPETTKVNLLTGWVGITQNLRNVVVSLLGSLRVTKSSSPNLCVVFFRQKKTRFLVLFLPRRLSHRRIFFPAWISPKLWKSEVLLLTFFSHMLQTPPEDIRVVGKVGGFLFREVIFSTRWVPDPVINGVTTALSRVITPYTLDLPPTQ